MTNQIPVLYAIGRNYADHAKEMGAGYTGSLSMPEYPILFMKNPSSVIKSGQPIVIPKIACQPIEQVDYESEIAVRIKTSLLNASRDQVFESIDGIAPANDVSARWWQKKGSGGQYVRGKSFDTFCPLGTFVSPSDLSDLDKLIVVGRLNGEEVQRGHSGSMIFPIVDLLVELSRGMTLVSGSVFLTGTPSGVGHAKDPPRYLREGDTFEVEVEGAGVVSNPVIMS